MPHARPPRTLLEAVALLNRLALDKGTQHALDVLLRTPGPGSWSRVAHLRVGKHHLTIRDLWVRIAPTRTRHARPSDFMRDLSRGRPVQPMKREKAEYPERIFDVFPLLVAIASEVGERRDGGSTPAPSA
jgi:hypothetical protein